MDYLKADYWDVREAAILLRGGTPMNDDGFISSGGMRPLRGGEPDPVKEICELARRAIDADELTCVGKKKHWRVRPADFARWAAEKGYPMPSGWDFANEPAALPCHPTGDYSKPIRDFPCALDALLALLAEHGLGDYIDSDAVEPPGFGQPAAPATSQIDPAMESDAALGAGHRAQKSAFALGNQVVREAREPEWEKWRAKAREIQAGRTRPASKRELARLVKEAFKLPDSFETIRHRL